jgi:hypothetical protein
MFNMHERLGNTAEVVRARTGTMKGTYRPIKSHMATLKVFVMFEDECREIKIMLA